MPTSIVEALTATTVGVGKGVGISKTVLELSGPTVETGWLAVQADNNSINMISKRFTLTLLK
jgi:hypothetical protein